MEWLNIHASTLDSENFIGSDPVQRSTWLCLFRYCAGQENGGIIECCREWPDRKWQQLCRVTLEEVNAESSLWTWGGQDLIVWRYPVDKESEIKAKREAGKATATKRWHPQANSSANSSAISSADTEGKGREGNRKGKKEKTVVVLPFDSLSFKATWEAWIDHRKKIKKPMSDYAQFLALAKLPKSEADAVKWIENALLNGWQGIYEPRTEKLQYGNPANRTPVNRLVNTWVDPNPPPEYKNAF